MRPPLPNWELLARNHIPGRDWGLIRNVWKAAALKFEPASTSDLSQLLEPIIGTNFEQRPHVSVFELSGGHVAAFHDAATALSKCWASVDAYHFSLLACRALLALLGIHFVHISNTRCVLDAFPEGNLDNVKTKFRKANRGAQNPARLIFRAYGSLIEQRAMWAILVRALRVTELPVDLKRNVDAICEIGEGFGRSRNEMLYGNSYWLYGEDFERPTVTVEINDDIHTFGSLADVFTGHRDANFALAAVLARLLIVLTSEVQSDSGIELIQTSYAPCLTKFSGFAPAKIDGLYATLYRNMLIRFRHTGATS